MKVTENSPFINIDAYTKHIEENKNNNSSNRINTENNLDEDKVELTSFKTSINKAKNLIGAIPDIREDKIADLKSQVENGTYDFKEKELASRILKESLLNELLS